MSKTDTRPQISNIPYWRNVANEGRGSQMTQCLHMACDYAVKLETDRAELIEALMNFMSQFAQALDAHEIPYGEEQDKADKQARALLARLEADK